MKTNPAAIDRDLTVGGKRLHLTNQQKIYFPEAGITKGEVVNYYNDIAPTMLPYLKDRPESLNRFPNGIHGSSFYQKDFDLRGAPAWLRIEKVRSASTKSTINYLVCNDRATLVFMANLGCIEINPWSSRTTRPDHPDWMVIDLDPEHIPFAEVVRAALEVRNVLERMSCPSYCKTSGATGLHVFVPLAGKYSYETVRTFANLIAQRVHEQLRGTTSIIRDPKKRRGRVYLDFLQNSRGQTLAAPYSLRPRVGATVSTPLEWSEVTARLDPATFTIKTIFARLEKKGDLWKPVLGKGVRLEQVVRSGG